MPHIQLKSPPLPPSASKRIRKALSTVLILHPRRKRHRKKKIKIYHHPRGRRIKHHQHPRSGTTLPPFSTQTLSKHNTHRKVHPKPYPTPPSNPKLPTYLNLPYPLPILPQHVLHLTPPDPIQPRLLLLLLLPIPPKHIPSENPPTREDAKFRGFAWHCERCRSGSLKEKGEREREMRMFDVGARLVKRKCFYYHSHDLSFSSSGFDAFFNSIVLFPPVPQL